MEDEDSIKLIKLILSYEIPYIKYCTQLLNLKMLQTKVFIRTHIIWEGLSFIQNNLSKKVEGKVGYNLTCFGELNMEDKNKLISTDLWQVHF